MNGDRRPRPTPGVRPIRTNGEKWRGIPVTVGLLVALVIAIGYLVNAIWQVESRASTGVARSIRSHNTNATAHPDIRAMVREVKLLRSDIRRTRGERRELMRLLREKAK